MASAIYTKTTLNWNPHNQPPTTTTESTSRFQRVVISLTRRTLGKTNQKSTENAGPSGILPGASDQTGQSSIEETDSLGKLPMPPAIAFRTAALAASLVASSPSRVTLFLAITVAVWRR
jgi:hypothetical protein